VRSRAVRPSLELRLRRSPGRIQGELADIEFTIEIHNHSAATASFAVITVGLDQLTSASFPSNTEWRWEDTVVSGSLLGQSLLPAVRRSGRQRHQPLSRSLRLHRAASSARRH
jgi:hypothetical protein